MPSGTSASSSSPHSFSTAILDSKCYWFIFADLFVVVVIIVIAEVVGLTFAVTLIMASTFAIDVTVTATEVVTGATSLSVVMAGTGTVSDAVLSNVEVTDNLERTVFACKQSLRSTPHCSGVNIQGGTLKGI